MRAWYDGIKAHGPDERLTLEIDDDALRAFRTRLRASTLNGLRLVADGTDADLYIDTRHAEQLAANIAGSDASNIYVYTSIRLGDGEAVFEHGYGADPTPDEARVLSELLTNPAAVGRWSISSGGNGYEWVQVAHGTDGASLLKRLT